MSVSFPELIRAIEKILDSAPNENSVRAKESIKNLLVRLQEEHTKNSNMLSLAYEELQKILRLVDHREEILKAIFDSSQDMILTLDVFGRVKEFNSSTMKLLDLAKEAISGRHFSEIIAGGTLLEALNSNSTNGRFNLVEDFTDRTMEKTIITLSGKTLNVQLYPGHLKSVKSEIYPLYIRDVTGLKQAEIELAENRALLALGAKMSSLGEMAGGIAHEINTPLAIIQMRIGQLNELISNNIFEKESYTKYADSVQNTVNRISHIINSLRTFARDGHGDPLTENSIEKIVDDTLGLCRSKFMSHGIAIEYKLASQLTILCRPSEISQVLLNLLNNSYDAIENLPEKWVRIESYSTSTGNVVTVTDSGPGIPLEIQKKLLQPFFTTKEIGKGTGLGLSISRRIMESHSGSISIDNDSPNTKFKLEFPNIKGS